MYLVHFNVILLRALQSSSILDRRKWAPFALLLPVRASQIQDKYTSLPTPRLHPIYTETIRIGLFPIYDFYLQKKPRNLATYKPNLAHGYVLFACTVT